MEKVAAYYVVFMHKRPILKNFELLYIHVNKVFILRLIRIIFIFKQVTVKIKKMCFLNKRVTDLFVSEMQTKFLDLQSNLVSFLNEWWLWLSPSLDNVTYFLIVKSSFNCS